MCNANTDDLLSLGAGREKSILWLETYYVHCKPFSISNMNVNVIFRSETLKPQYVDICFEFQLVRISELEFRITCIKLTTNLSPPGMYTLQFHCSGNIFEEDPKVVEMQFGQFMVFERFYLNDSYRNYLSQSDLNREIKLQILVKMIEYDCSITQIYMQQEGEFRQMKEKFFNNETLENDLCYILQIPRLEDIFTGRQNNEFAQLKRAYIMRTSPFLKEIAGYMRAKHACCSVPLIDLGVILNYIFTGELTPIVDDNLFKVYLKGHYLGLNFLVDLSRDCILGRFHNQIFLIETFQVAECVNDEYLFEKAAVTFHIWVTEGMNSTSFLEMLNASINNGPFVVLSLYRRLNRIESAGRAQIGESSEPSTSKITFLK